MTNFQFIGTATQPHRNWTFRQFNNDQYYTHPYHHSCINSLKIHVRPTLNKGDDKGTALARSVVVIYYWGLKPVNERTANTVCIRTYNINIFNVEDSV